VLITVLVLELRYLSFHLQALLLLWLTWLSYAVSYLFIAIVWTITLLMRYAGGDRVSCGQFRSSVFHVAASPRRLDGRERIGGAPVPLCGGLLPRHATYICLIWELIDRAPVGEVSPKVRRIMRIDHHDLCLFGGCGCGAEYPLADSNLHCCSSFI